VTRREELRTSLAKAEAALTEAVVNSAVVDRHPVETNLSLDKARAYCRQARDAVAALDRSESLAISGEGIDTLIRHLGEVSDQGTATTTATPRADAGAIAGEGGTSRDEFRRHNPLRRIDSAIVKSTVIRHATSLLALTLAYLQYYYFDIQLEIMSLPSVTTFPVQ
jgi:hypothetical protein